MYEKLTLETIKKLETEKPNFAFNDKNAIRRNEKENSSNSEFRSNFIKDIDKIINCPYFPRYADKTQVLSFYKNDDITHRSMHVQFVSRIARTIGKALNLNLELIEAIALGHDLGHTPFGHAGEYALDKIYFEKSKRHFFHNVQSVRVLEKIFPLNVSLQTLDGIICHNGELELDKYSPSVLKDFNEFDERVEKCYVYENYNSTLIPSTLEGCVMRVSDIIAYLGKDRQDAIKIGLVKEEDFSNSVIGNFNAEIINNLTVNIIENSFNNNYISLDKDHFEGLKQAKKENGEKIYFSKSAKTELNAHLYPMMRKLYDKLFSDLINKDVKSPIYTHHIDYINSQHYKRTTPYGNEEPNQIVVDYITSMTDDYFVDVYNHLFSDSEINITYKGYFD